MRLELERGLCTETLFAATGIVFNLLGSFCVKQC